MSVKFEDVWVQAGATIGDYKITCPTISKKLDRDIKVGDTFNIKTCEYTGYPDRYVVGYGIGSIPLEVTKLPSNGSEGQLRVTFRFTPSED